MLSNKRVIMLFVLTVLANCLGNLSSDAIKNSVQVMNRLCLRFQQRMLREHCLARDKPLHVDNQS